MSLPSTSSTQWKYDVFLSFRGEDTRMKFTGHLYEALQHQGIITFRDDPELKKGKTIGPELFSAIGESRFALVVLSENYASSTWCLEELVRILEYMKPRNAVLPIFYDVKPSDVRKQTESFQKAFTDHEERFKHEKEKVQRWRSALTEVASFSGWSSKGCYEPKLIEVIVEAIWEKLQPTLCSPVENLVGMESRLQSINLHLGLGVDDVRFIGIWGMGGIGKTTIARVVHEKLSNQFQYSFLLSDVRNAVEKGSLLGLQKQLLSGIWSKREEISDLHLGATIIRRLFRSNKVLLILDDVNQKDQLKYLAGDKKWFGKGSRVLITTRDEHLLIEHEVERRLKIEKLNIKDSLKLFCWKAFKGATPKKEFLGLAKSFTNHAEGLPLALEVLGSFLYGRSLSEWNSDLGRLGKVHKLDIFDILKISYDDLNFEEQKIFLDIACFFHGEDKKRVTDVLISCDISATIGMKVLMERSLLTISYGRLWIHQLLREVGWEIVRKESPDDLGRRSRLWLRKDVNYVLSKNTGTEAVEGIFVDSTDSRVKVDVQAKSFTKMSKLRYLKIDSGNLTSGLECLPDSLRILDWTGYQSKSLPQHFNPEKLVELSLCHSCIEHFRVGRESIFNLKSVNLSHSVNLVSTPNFKDMPYLELLILEGCTRLCKVDSSIEVLERLTVLNMKDCKNLMHFASSVCGFKALKVLNLSGCSKLRKLPNDMSHLQSLEKLFVDGTGIRELPPSTGMLERLSHLHMEDCKDFVCLPSSVGGLKSLEVLNLSGCLKIDKLPDELGHVDRLEHLDVSRTGIRELPSSIGNLKNLKHLSFRGCKGQPPKSWNVVLNPFQLFLKRSRHIPAGLSLHCLSGLHSLTSLDLSNCNISEGGIPSDLGCLSMLIVLNLSRNQFVTLPDSISRLSRLEFLSLDCCLKLETLSELPSHVVLDVNGCSSLDTILSPTVEYGSALSSAECINCFKMLENGSFKSVALSLLLRYLQEPDPEEIPGYDRMEMAVNGYAGFSFVAPGNVIPEWINHQREGSSITQKLHSGWLNGSWMGIAVCAVFRLLKPIPPSVLMDIFISLTANGEEFNEERPSLKLKGEWGQPVSDHIWLFYINQDQCFEISWQDIDYELEVSFGPKYTRGTLDEQILRVSKCGVRMIYEEDVEELEESEFNQSNVQPFDDEGASSSAGIATATSIRACVVQEQEEDEEEEPRPKRFKQLNDRD